MKILDEIDKLQDSIPDDEIELKLPKIKELYKLLEDGLERRKTTADESIKAMGKFNDFIKVREILESVDFYSKPDKIRKRYIEFLREDLRKLKTMSIEDVLKEREGFEQYQKILETILRDEEDTKLFQEIVEMFETEKLTKTGGVESKLEKSKILLKNFKESTESEQALKKIREILKIIEEEKK